MEDSPLVMRLNSGRTLPVNTCNCGHCQNEWMPNFCPYCGIKFESRTVDGQPQKYLPSDESTT